MIHVSTFVTKIGFSRFRIEGIIQPASDVSAAILVERTIAKFHSIIMQSLRYIFLLFWHQHCCLITRVQ